MLRLHSALQEAERRPELGEDPKSRDPSVTDVPPRSPQRSCPIPQEARPTAGLPRSASRSLELHHRTAAYVPPATCAVVAAAHLDAVAPLRQVQRAERGARVAA